MSTAPILDRTENKQDEGKKNRLDGSSRFDRGVVIRLLGGLLGNHADSIRIGRIAARVVTTHPIVVGQA
jgi:hypothetical protein